MCVSEWNENIGTALCISERGSGGDHGNEYMRGKKRGTTACHANTGTIMNEKEGRGRGRMKRETERERETERTVSFLGWVTHGMER